MKTYHFIVKGLVQGVCFRYYTQKAAHQFSVTGTVKNLDNGNIEVYAQGEEKNIKEFEAFLNKGPVSARVDRLTREEFEESNVYHSFEIIF